MTADQRLQRDLPEILAQLAPRVVPDYRDDVIRVTAAARQRPAWTFTGRWLPVDMTAGPGSRPRPMTALVTLLLVAAIVGATLVAVVGSRQRSLPAPFGPAVNGALYFASNGDIYRQDSPTSAPTAIVTDDAFDSSVLPSRDGTRLALVRPLSSGTRIVVTNADGRDPRPLDGIFSTFSELDWSPDGREIAVISERPGYPTLTILPVDGSASRDIDLPGTMTPTEIWYLPDGRILFDGTTHEVSKRGATSTYGLYLLDPASDAPPTVVSPPTTEDLKTIGARPSPDGTKVVYHRWREPDEMGRIRLIDVQSQADTPLAVDYPDEEFADENAQFSPDGTQLLFTRYLAAGNQLMLVPVTGGAPVPIGELTPGNDAPEATFSPDGRSVIARYHDGHVWLLDATGAGKDEQLDLAVTEMPTWQRLGE